MRLALVGEGPRRKALQKLAGKLGVASRVIFAGQQEYSRVAVWMAAADWLVLASFREGWPTVYHEAMACGRPVITSGVAAARYAVCDQELGIVVRENTPHGFAQAIAQAQGRTFDADAIRRHAMRYDWRQWAAAYMTVVEPLLQLKAAA